MVSMKTAGDVKLAIKQARKVYVFEHLRDGKMNNSEAASALGLSIRQVQRTKKAFETEGYLAFVHGNAGKKPLHALSKGSSQNNFRIFIFLIRLKSMLNFNSCGS
jgi:hypothetical protein